MFDYLFKPIKINKLEIKNRIAYPALGLMYSLDTKLNDKYYNFFKERAKGGAAIVTVGPVGVDYLGSGFAILSLANDDAIPSFKKLTDIIRDEGASPWVQLFHAGAYTHPILINGEDPIAPSPVYSSYSKATPKEMTTEQISEVQNAFADAAKRAVAAGFDGVEIIASAGYLITQFLSPLKNKRDDEYGGSFENRTRFPKELFTLVRKRLGKDFPLTVRMAGNDFVTGSNTDAETPRIAQLYEQVGVDAINVTGGWHESKVPQLPMDLPQSGFAYLAYNIKKVVSVPVFASNRIASPDMAEKIIRDGAADIVNLGRVLIADPKWPQKAQQGRSDEIRPCVACSQGCTDQVFSGMPVFCIGNPKVGLEKEREIVKTSSPKKIMVIGAGAAGLEAAITATKIGHSVTVYEKDSEIGGQIWLAGAPPHKHDLLEFARYYKAMIKKYKIKVILNTTANIETIKSDKPDFIIFAQGAKPITPPIKGVDSPNVISSWDVLKKDPLLGKKVAIIGGGSVGLETAAFVAAKGTITPEVLHFLFLYNAEPVERLKELMFKGTSKVTVFEMLPKAGKDVGKSTKWILFANLRRYGVKIHTSTKVVSIKDGTITYEKDSEPVTKQYDTIITALGSESVNTLQKKVEKLDIPHISAGDCITPGKLNNAIHGGYLAAMKIDELTKK